MRSACIAWFLLLALSATGDGADVTCDLDFPCAMNPCWYTKCRAGFECQNCNCTYSCVPVTGDWTLLGLLHN
ncbi:hypothetical protein BsWGS_18148 [Bradybaena similaris]